MADIFDRLGGDVFDRVAPTEQKRPPYGFAPGKELDPEGFGIRDEAIGDPTLPKARLRDVPGIAGRGVVSAELGVAKGVMGTLDAMLNIPEEKVRKVGTPWAPSQFILTAEEKRRRTAPIREAKRRIVSAQERFDTKYSGGLAWGTRVVSEAVPYMANAMAAGVVAGPIGAATVGFVIEGDNAYDEAITTGATEEQAQQERVIVGSINAAIEAVQVGRVLRFTKSGKHSVRQFIKRVRDKSWRAAGGELKGFTADVLRLSVEEAIEEFGQEGVSLGVPAMLRGEYPTKEDGSPDWWAIGERLGGAALGGAVAAPFLGGAGSIIAGTGRGGVSQDTEAPTDIPPGSNIYRTAEDRIVVETPADIGTEQGTELRDGRVYERTTGEELFQVEEGTVSGIQDAPLSKELTQIEFKPIEDVEGGFSYGRSINSLPPIKEGMVRLYRAETGIRTETVEGDIKTFGQDDKGTGGWFTTDFGYALNFYEGAYGKITAERKISYMDVPKQSAEEHFKGNIEGTKDEYFYPELRQDASLPKNEEIGRQYGLDNDEIAGRLTQAEDRFQKLNQKETTKRTVDERREFRFLAENRDDLDALIDWETTEDKTTVGKQKRKPIKSQYIVGHEIPKILGMSKKERRAFMKKETGKTSMAKMSPLEAQDYIDALHKLAKKKGIDTGILPSERKFKKPIIGLTPQLYKAKILGVEFMINPAAIGKQRFDLEITKYSKRLDVMKRIIDRLGGETRKTRIAARIKNKPTKSVARFAELLNKYEEPPASLTTEEKAVFNYFRNLNRTILTRENAVREELGMEPIAHKAGYMRHIVDVMAEDIIDGRHPMPEELKYWAEKNASKRITNPMEYQRKLGDELGEIFSNDLIKATKAMMFTGLREVHLNKPLKFFETQMALHSEVIPDSTRRWTEDFINHMIIGKQTNTDARLNEMIKDSGIGKVVNKVLKPFGRKISNRPFTNLLGKLGRLQIYGVMGLRPKTDSQK